MKTKPALFNSVLASKIYGVWHGNKEITTVQASDVHEAFDLAKENKKCRGLSIAVIKKGEVKR